jgi:hypothetical protein
MAIAGRNAKLALTLLLDLRLPFFRAQDRCRPLNQYKLRLHCEKTPWLRCGKDGNAVDAVA